MSFVTSWLCSLSVVVCVAALGYGASAADEVIDRVLAVAGGEVITLSDVRAARELGRVNVSGAADPEGAIVAELIDRALVLAEVDRFAPPEPTTDAIDSALASVVANFPSPTAFDAALTTLGLDRPYVRELLREDLRIRAYLDQRFAADSPDDQRRTVDDWIAGLRRRGDVVNLYEQGLSGPARDTGAPG